MYRQFLFYVAIMVLLAPQVSVAGTVQIATTDASIAVRNLEGQIATLEKLVATYPKEQRFRHQLVRLLSTRTQFLGSYLDFERMRELTLEEPSNSEELNLRVLYLTSVHEFSAAETLITQSSENSLVRQGAVINLARRDDLPELRNQLNAQLATARTFDNIIIIAGVEAELGNFKTADSLYEEALEAYTDSSPFPVAYVYFQRGVMWAEKAGDEERGREMYEKAIAHLPQYVVASVHLAEILHEQGETERAISILRNIADVDDPEPKGLLGEILIDQGSTSEGQQLVEAAANQYDVLLSSFPKAFADHGSEFFSGPGDNPQRGLELAQANLENRKNERAYLVAIEAAQAANESAVLCMLVKEVESIGPVFVPLKDTLREISC